MKRVVILSALLVCTLVGGVASSFATTVTFTEILLNSGDPFTNQYAAYNLNGLNDYYYIDSRDTFDQHGISNTANPGIIQFLMPVNSLSIDYVLINQVVATFEIFNAAHMSLGTFTDNALNGDKNASYDFGGVGIAELDFSGSTGVVGVSTLRFTTTPEPSSVLLLGSGLLGLAGAIRRKINL